MKFRYYTLALATAAALAAGCESAPSSESTTAAQPATKEHAVPEKKAEAVEIDKSKEAAAKTPKDFAGKIDRQAILENDPNWLNRYKKTSADNQTAKSLAEVKPGARVDVYLGVWCSDSVREVTRFWQALDAAGDVPFDINYIGLDRRFDAGEVSLDDLNIRAVPTFIVYRDGEEVGRIIERAPKGIETELLAILVK